MSDPASDPADAPLPTLPHKVRGTLAPMGPAEAATHATMATHIDYARRLKTAFCSTGQEAMWPVLFAYDGAGELLVEVVIDMSRSRAGDPRPAMFRVADRLARGVAAHKIVLYADMYHQSEADVPPDRPLAEGSMAAAHKAGAAAAVGIGECIDIIAIDRALVVTQTFVPFEWDRPKKEAGLTWFPGDDRTRTTATEPGTLMGLIPRTFRQIMQEPLLVDDPQFAALAETLHKGCAREDRLRLCGQSAIVVLTVDEHCICKVFGDRFGTGEEIQRLVKVAQDERARPPLTKEDMEKLVKEFTQVYDGGGGKSGRGGRRPPPPNRPYSNRPPRT